MEKVLHLTIRPFVYIEGVWKVYMVKEMRKVEFLDLVYFLLEKDGEKINCTETN